MDSSEASSDTTNSLRSLQATGKSPPDDPSHYSIQLASKVAATNLHKEAREPLSAEEANTAYGFGSIEDCEPFAFELESLGFPTMPFEQDSLATKFNRRSSLDTFNH